MMMMMGLHRRHLIRSAINSSSRSINVFSSKSDSIIPSCAIGGDDGDSVCLNEKNRSLFHHRSFNSDSSSSSSNISAPSYHLSGGPSYMKGAVFWEPNKPLTFEDFHMPRPKAGEILIKTKGT